MFCICGTLIYVKSNSTKVECLRCKKENSVDMIRPIYTEVEIKGDSCIEAIDVSGAKIKHRCPACGAEEMMYNTVQVRSTDEGQTVFYSCECGYKFTVQS
ncbi:DNA-directed RNA polymerase I subunit M [Encephalitozoon romaleae SJ-2008]|uniref:DNA-directed RNA polymerase I subunit RPA12 n=1 Tax=Encephalitozoon romaleae (strain SJ-2008) TaxID=1178016 RepID=I7AFN3_ENCRO|nr:DNA-directed RNA polymerase I subunit M [Encephalitozoon romaleae SJ-2008]AFN83550.1 DNA-directed RNA polymerase I subunit M [Encephalitozoon romaleae SJ-2008]